MNTLDILGRAADWAREGGRIARERLGQAVASRKIDDSIVTDGDHAVQQYILDQIAAVFPSHAVITEETIARPERHSVFSSAKWCWVIDPIDGTRNYARGLPCFAVSVAVLCDGHPEAAVVYSVMDDRLFSAHAGGGAWCDGRQLHVVDNPPTGDTLLGAPSGSGDPVPPVLHAWLEQMTVRNHGSVALHLAYVAAGWFDAAVCLKSKIWDVAAGALLVTEAGGVASDLEGRPLFPLTDVPADGVPRAPILAAAPNLHRYLTDTHRLAQGSRSRS